MPAVGITDGPPTCARDHRAVVLKCSHLARKWAAFECRSAWLVVDSTKGRAGCWVREVVAPSRCEGPG